MQLYHLFAVAFEAKPFGVDSPDYEEVCCSANRDSKKFRDKHQSLPPAPAPIFCAQFVKFKFEIEPSPQYPPNVSTTHKKILTLPLFCRSITFVIIIAILQKIWMWYFCLFWKETSLTFQAV